MSKLTKPGFVDNGSFVYEKDKFGEIDLEEIKVNFKNNVRTNYNEQEIKELAKSIQEDGQLQPIGLDEKDNLVYGFRRYKAIKEILKLKKIKYVRVSYKNLEVIQLVENIQREDLSDYEIASSLSKLKKELKATNKDLSLRLNKSEKWIEDKIKHSEIIEETASHVDVGTNGKLIKLPTSIVNETRNLAPKERAEVLTSGKSQKEIRDTVKSKSHVDVGNKSNPEKEEISLDDSKLRTLAIRKFDKKEKLSHPEKKILKSHFNEEIARKKKERMELTKEIEELTKKRNRIK